MAPTFSILVFLLPELSNRNKDIEAIIEPEMNLNEQTFSLDVKRRFEMSPGEIGVLGRFFGSGANLINNIAGLILITGFMLGGLITLLCLIKGVEKPYEVWKYIAPLITLSLGYIVGGLRDR